jgi:Ricin-type beta-trefoil lectin domain
MKLACFPRFVSSLKRRSRIFLTAMLLVTILTIVTFSLAPAAHASPYDYYFGNLNSNLYLDASGASQNPGDPIIQWYFNGQANQQWVLGSSNSVSYTITNLNSDLCLDASGASLNPGDPIIQWPCNGQSNQQWILHPTSSCGGCYYIQNLNSGLYLDVNGASQNPGNPIIQWYFNGQANQQWQELINY